ncbi:MAG: ATP-dependent helicase, partial [Acidimicrobiales bacterium]
FGRYEADKRRAGVVDFDDLVSGCAHALETDTEFAAAQRWRFRHLFVDEFQDLNPAQFRLLRGWLGDRDDLCVVGDPDQAIYSWNGADPTLLVSFADHFPTATVLRLDRNYRSTPQIVATAATLVASRHGPLCPSRQPEGPVPTVVAYDSGRTEARGVATRLHEAHRPGRSWSHMAVLMRTNGQAALVIEALDAAGIPYRAPGAGPASQTEAAAVLGQLRGNLRPPAIGATIADLRAMVDEAPVDRQPALDQLADLARTFATLDPLADLDAFSAWLATLDADGPAAGAGHGVEITTLHRAKGLEWPVVFIIGLEQGLVPFGSRRPAAAEAEERRLLYVGLTRATHELNCSWARTRMVGGRSLRRQPSPYLALIGEVRDALAAGEGPGDWRAALAEGRARLAPR